MATNDDTTDPNHGIVLPNWIVGPDAEQLVEFAVAAEQAGWDGVFLADHLTFPHGDYDGPDNMDFHDPWITMAGIATRTETVRLVSWITPVPRRQPWQLARDLATLDRLSDGRVILGAGLGEPSTNYPPFGRSSDLGHLAARYDEALEIIDGLWSGESVSYEGEHFTIDDAVLLPTPVQEPRIPIVAGGIWPNRAPLERGARWDGIVPHYRGDGVVPSEGMEGIVPPLDGTPEEDAREMMAYYREVADDPGEVMLPLDPPHGPQAWTDLCEDFGATWLYSRELRGGEYVGNPDQALEYITAGPQADRREAKP